MPRRPLCPCGTCKTCVKRLDMRAKRAALKNIEVWVPRPEAERVRVRLTLTPEDVFGMKGSAL